MQIKISSHLTCNAGSFKSRNYPFMISCICIFACHIIFPLSARGDSAQTWNGAIATINGTPHIMNPADPIDPQKTIKAQKLWQVGDEFGDDDQTLGFVADILVDEEGNSYLLDSSFMVIRVLGPDGTHLRDIGGEGEGPGEFQMAYDFVFLPDGKIGVVQVMPAKVITLDRQGIPSGRFSLAEGDHGMSKIERAESAGDHLVIGMMLPNFSAGAVEHVISFHDADGCEVNNIVKKDEKQAGGNMNIGGNHKFDFTRYWDVNASGSVFVAPQKDAYSIDVYNSSGKLEHVIRREYNTLPRSKNDLAVDRKRTEELAARFGGMVAIESRKNERDIEDLHARDEGELWVSSSRGSRECPPNMIGNFDVFDEEGRFTHSLNLVADYDVERDSYILTGDRLFVLKEAKKRPSSVSFGGGGGMTTISFAGGSNTEEDDNNEEPVPPSVICYQLPRNQDSSK